VYATLGQQLKFVKQDAGDNSEQQVSHDSLHRHDNEVHEHKWNHSFAHRLQNDFVEMAHIVFMNHLGMECWYYIVILRLVATSQQ